MEPHVGTRGRIVAAACIACALAVSQSPAVAWATTRTVSPTGTGTACTSLAPCDLQTGVNGATSGDVVSIRQGEYALSGPLVVNAPNVLITGYRRVFTATITSSGAFLVAGTSATDLVVQQLRVVADTTSAPAISGNAVTLRSLDITSSAGANPVVDVRDLTMRSTAVRTGAASGVGVRTANATIVGSTIVANGGTGGRAVLLSPDSFSGVTSAVARIGSSIAVGGAHAIAMAPGTGQTVDLSIDYSSYAGIFGAGTASTPAHIGSHNVGPPSLVDLPGRTDLHQLVSSSTVDAGNPADAGNEGDIDGSARTLGETPDIGADEYTAGPSATVLAPDRLTPFSARLRAYLVPALEGGTQYRFDYGPTAAYGFSTGTYTAGAQPAIVTAPVVTQLAVDSVVHYRLVVTSGLFDSITSDDKTFRTLRTPPGLTHFTIPKSRTPSGQPFNMHFRINRPARLVVIITRVRQGHMAGGECRLTATTGPGCLVRTRRAVLRTSATPAPLIVWRVPAAPGGRPLRPGRYEFTAFAVDPLTGYHDGIWTVSHEIRP